MRKLVAIHIYCNGRRVNVFCYGTVCEDGRTRVSMDIINAELAKLNVTRGQTYTVG